jgi:hypothetical protein
MVALQPTVLSKQRLNILNLSQIRMWIQALFFIFYNSVLFLKNCTKVNFYLVLNQSSAISYDIWVSVGIGPPFFVTILNGD